MIICWTRSAFFNALIVLLNTLIRWFNVLLSCSNHIAIKMEILTSPQGKRNAIFASTHNLSSAYFPFYYLSGFRFDSNLLSLGSLMDFPICPSFVLFFLFKLLTPKALRWMFRLAWKWMQIKKILISKI